jgi:hypothetical protein
VDAVDPLALVAVSL